MDYRQVFAIIIPIFIDQALIVLMSIINTAMISSSGVAAISAVSTVDTINFFIMSVFIAVATGGTVIVAQYKGSGDQQMASRAATQSVTVVTGIAIVISAIMLVFHASALNFLFGNAEEAVFHNATIFLIASCISFPFLAVQQAAAGVLRGVSETKASLGLSLVMNITYLCLNIILVLGFDMGIVGISISIVASRLVGAVTSLLYLIKFNQSLQYKIKNAFKLNLAIFKKIMFIGFPFATEQLFFNGGKLLTQTFIVQFGTLALTVNAIGNSISMLLQIGGTTLSIAIVTIVGQSIGRRDIADARKFVKSFIGLGTVVFTLFALIILPFFPLLVKLYSTPDEIVSEVFMLVLIISIAQPIFWTLSFVLPSALRAAGDSTFTSTSALLSMWLFRIVFGYVLGIVLGFGLIGIWVAMVAEWGVRGAIFWWRFRGEKWYKHKLLD